MPKSTAPRLAPYDNIAFLRCIVSVVLDFLPMRTPILAPQREGVAEHWDVPTAQSRILAYPVYALIAIRSVVVYTLAVPFADDIVVPDTGRVRRIRRISRNKINKANEPWVCDIPIKIPTIAPILAPRILEFYDIFSFVLGKFYRYEVVSCRPRIRLVCWDRFVWITESNKVILINTTPCGGACNNRNTTAKYRNSLKWFADEFEPIYNAFFLKEFERMSRVCKRWAKHLQFLVYRIVVDFLPHFLKRAEPRIARALRRLPLIENSHIIFPS